MALAAMSAGFAMASSCASAQQIPEQPAAEAAPEKSAPAKGAKGRAPHATGKQADPASADRALDMSIKYYESGKPDQAVQALNLVLQSGALPPARMARALYYRGLAHKKLGKPAQAISDLTSALWLKNGLAPGERDNALAQRSAAYKEAGLAEPPIETAAKGTATPSASAPAVTAAAGAPSSGGFFSGLGNMFTGGGKSDAAPATTGSVAAPPPAAVAAAAPKAPVVTAAVAPAPVAAAPAAVAAPPPPAAAPAPDAPASGGGIGGFFGNLGNVFSGGSAKADPPQQAGVGTAPASPAPAVSSWSQPQVSGAPAAKAAQVAAVTAPPAVVPAASAGRFRLQIAAVRTRAEADSILAKVKKEYGRKLGASLMVDEATVGDMGTFYRVRVGPYEAANKPRQLCITLRTNGGYDCMVVTE